MKTKKEAETHKLRILKQLEKEPVIRQVDLASRLGLGVGTVNSYLKQLSKKDFINVKRVGQRQWRYSLTPKGIEQKSKLTRNYIKRSMKLYRRTRKRSRELIHVVKQNGYQEVRIDGNNDLVEVCRLTCIEQGLKEINSGKTNPETESIPTITVKGRKLVLDLPESQEINHP